jgi:Rrf2 family protein
MLFSKTTGYGIRALVYLAKQSESQLCGLQEIAENEHIPSAYLGKILGDLRKHQLLRSVKGIHGGYELALSPDSITLWDVYQILDPLIDCDQCILGLAHCEDKCPCALHDSWMPIKDEFVHLLRTKTIAQISNGN